MHRFAQHLFIAAVLLLPTLADARPTALRQRCDAPSGVVTRRQAQVAPLAYAGCQIVEEQVPTCNPDQTLCACFNTGTVEDFVTCGWGLIAACESTPGCAWWQKPNGDVYCACGANPLP